MSIYIWNNLDEAALYLGLSRLDGETNDEFVSRMKQFARWKYKTDYYTQSHSIPIQLGLNTNVIGRISTSGNKYNCNIDWDYFILEEIKSDNTVGEFIRIFIGSTDCTVQKIYDIVNSSQSFLLDVYNTDDLNLSIDYLIRNKNVKIENTIINGRYSYVNNKDIVRGSIRVNNPSYRKEVFSITDLKRNGEYYVDYSLGFIQTYDMTPTAANIYYSYYDPAFALEKTELGLIPMNRYFNYGITDNNIALIPDLLNNLVSSI